MQVFHSVGQNPLVAATEAVANDNSGGGEYHFALLKLADAEQLVFRPRALLREFTSRLSSWKTPLVAW